MKKENELKPYKYDKFSKIPSWIKILFLKFWAAAAAFYFAGMGSFIGESNDLVYFVMIAFVTAIFMDYLVRPVVRLMKNSKDDVYRFNLINITGTPALLLNLLYAFLITEPIGYLAQFVIANNLWFSILGSSAKGTDPFLWGILYLLVDGVFLGIKNLVLYIKRRRKANTGGNNAN